MLNNVLKFVVAGAAVVGTIAAIDAIAEAKEAAKKAAKEKADAELRRNLFEVQRDFAVRFANTGLESVDLARDYTDQEMVELVKRELAARA